MKQGFLVLVAAALLQTAARGQVTLPASFQLTNNAIVPSPYPPGTAGIQFLQATTNLLQPILWNDQTNSKAGLVSVPNVYPQQFFRIG